ncbi:MAG: acyl-CoA dehydrogenase family protein, partial [Acidimicrobiales bacterium]
LREVGQGWAVALTTLAHERRLAAAARRPEPDRDGRLVLEAAAEWARAMEPYVWYPQRAGRADLVTERAVATGRHTDPLVRQEIAKLIALTWSAKWTAQRAAAARAIGRPPGPEGSLGKLASSNIARAASGVHALIAGASGMLAGSDAPLDGIITEIFVSVPAVSIAGGTDEIQRKILGERILGLPKEPLTDADQAFRHVPRNPQR